MHARKTIVSQNSTAEIFLTHSKKGTIASVKRDPVPAGSGKDAKLSLAFNTLQPMQIMSVLEKGDLYGHSNLFIRGWEVLVPSQEWSYHHPL
mgnify:CR=1 FL=1